MDLKSDLLTVADCYCAATGMSKARLATILANDGKFFERIEGGGGFNIRRFEDSMRWLSEHWPDNVKWPGSVMRPRDRSTAA